MPARSGAGAPGVPQLSGLEINVDAPLLGRWSTRLFDGARRSGAANLAHLTLDGRIDWRAIFAAALRCDEARLREIASAQATDASAFAAVAMLLPFPFLQACNRRWAAARAAGWNAGYCPTCGAWPAFAEVPAGWKVVHGKDTRQACLDYVNENWTDMRPKSLADAMDS